MAFRPPAASWQGSLTLDLDGLSSRLSPLAPLGSYRLSLHAREQAPTPTLGLRLETLDPQAPLQLQGEGQVAQGRLQFRGEARAAPGREAALNNVLNIIGRREGERSRITIG